jgi:hypothetical protein
VRTLVVLCSVLAAFGCKGKPKAKPAPPNAATGVVNGSGDRAAPDLLLPHADGTPPKKTTAPLVKADFEKLSKLSYPGFTSEIRTLGDKILEVRFRTKDRPVLWAVVTVSPCLDCLPMELEKWKAREAELKTISLETLKDAPGIDWEMGETKLFGERVIYTYQVGTGSGSGDAGGPSVSFTDNYVAYYNDGINQIRVVGAYKDDPTSKEELIKIAPKGDLEALALAFLDVYTHAW